MPDAMTLVVLAAVALALAGGQTFWLVRRALLRLRFVERYRHWDGPKLASQPSHPAAPHRKSGRISSQ
jgi:hypothetical protein